MFRRTDESQKMLGIEHFYTNDSGIWDTSKKADIEKFQNKNTPSDIKMMVDFQDNDSKCGYDDGDEHVEQTAKPGPGFLNSIPCAGILLAIFASTCGAFNALLIKVLRHLGPSEIFGLRCVIQIVLLVPIMLCTRPKMFFAGQNGMILSLRAILGTGSFVLYYFGFFYLPIGDASLIFFSQPIYTSLLACFFLGESCGPFEVFTVLVDILGVALVASPSFLLSAQGFSHNHIVGCLCAIGAAAAEAVIRVGMRRLQDVPKTVVIFWWSVCASLVTLLGTWSLGFWQNPENWLEILYVLLIGVVGLLSQAALTTALYIEEAGRVSIAGTSEIIVAYILQLTVLGEAPQITSVIGALLVITGIILSGIKQLKCTEVLKKASLWVYIFDTGKLII
ncbi:solute carrier family 35 member G1-like isoform X2 [Tachypleus tridentatus]|uniref:solute carrier family 35 member G1-like isoform X2 n=1 Tax=Tachypleus tridentatus TaxID=6853 RepID=UPI003FCFDFB9